MTLSKKSYTKAEIAGLLRGHEINPTSQRVEIAQALYLHGEHVSAEEMFAMVNCQSVCVSKATVYNTLGLFAKRGLIREVVADPARIFYDPNIAPHHHFYDTSTGKLMDIPADEVQIRMLPALPEGMSMEGVDVVVRMRPAVPGAR
jgi:Fur family iron response transcriptional regulator